MPDQTPVNSGYGYEGYGYELANLLNRYGVQSPTVPRRSGSPDDASYQSLLDKYQKTAQSTPMYNMPKGNNYYNDLTKDVLYGDPKTYFETRGITQPTQMRDVSNVFGWRPGQVDSSMGWPTGTSQDWLNQNPSGQPVNLTQPPQPQVPKPVVNYDGYNVAPPGYDVTNPSTWTPEMLSYAQSYDPFAHAQGAAPVRPTGDDWWNQASVYNLDVEDPMKAVQDYAQHALTTESSSYGGDAVISPGEASTLLNLAQKYNLSPEQMGQTLGYSTDEVVNYLQNHQPHHAYNYLQTHGYAEGGLVGEADPLSTDINDLLLRYLTQSGEAESGVTEAQTRSRDANTKMRSAIDKMLEEPAQVPSRAELWWKLAAAFAQPGGTGSFGEGLGRAASATADHQAATRDATVADRQAKQRLAIEALGLDAQQARSELDTARLLSTQASGNVRSVISDVLRNQQPRSTAGQQAVDEGLTPGTPEYTARVAEINNRPAEAQALREQVAAAQAEARTAQIQAREAAASRMSPTELNMLAETEDAVESGRIAMENLTTALALNPNTYDNSLPQRGQYRMLSAMGSDDERVVNTRELENLLGGQALERLRATFGGAPTEGERAILMDLQGIGAKSIEERRRIIERAMEVLNSKLRREQERVEAIRSGAYRTYAPPGGADVVPE